MLQSQVPRVAPAIYFVHACRIIPHPLKKDEQAPRLNPRLGRFRRVLEMEPSVADITLIGSGAGAVQLGSGLDLQKLVDKTLEL
tara:strand:+ start:136 stop:387 length:252 start_codon:yes stop_codon:yes gene_type:complete